MKKIYIFNGVYELVFGVVIGVMKLIVKKIKLN